MERDQQFLEYVVKSLVDNPTDVKINRTVDEMGVLLTLSVNKDDMQGHWPLRCDREGDPYDPPCRRYEK